jgi:membrane-bound lytic murein transglycosylase A
MRRFLIGFIVFLSGCFFNVSKVQNVKSDCIPNNIYEPTIKCAPDEVLVCKKVEMKAELYKLNEKEIPFFKRDFNDSFKRAYNLTIEYLDKNLDKNISYDFGTRKVDIKTVKNTVLKLREILENSKDDEDFNKKLRENFDIYELRRGTEPVLFSSYYEPIFDASLSKNDIYKFPIYKKPDDLYEINLEDFDPDKYKGQKLTGRIVDKRFVPYYSRKEIDFDGVLKNKGYELAYLKTMTDVLDLHTQGSGILKLDNGKYVRAKFAATNSLKFKGWMSYLLEKGYIKREGNVGKDKTFYDRAVSFINSRPELWEEVFGSNKRYVFFMLDEVKSVDEGPIGTYGLNLVAQRSVAVDNSIIPLGIIGYINLKLPDVDENLNVKGFSNKERFIFAHDTGGAIKGARIDYFAGTGDIAKKFAYSVWDKGNLYIFVIKEDR